MDLFYNLLKIKYKYLILDLDIYKNKLNDH